MSGLALVTGAAGFVGSHLTDHLLERGYRVRCLLRPTSNPRWLPRDRVEIVRGEMTRPESLEPAVRDVEFIFHSAGVMRTAAPPDYERINVEGTRNLARAASRLAPGLRRFVLVSSLAAGGFSHRGRPRSEADPDAPGSAYGRSKLGSENVLEGAGRDLPWTVLRPGALYGPRDHGAFVLARLARKGWAVRITGPAQEVQLLYASDLVEALRAAAESPRALGRKYYLSHPETTGWTEVGQLMGRALGRPVRVLRVPRGLVPWFGRAAGWGSGLLGRPNPVPSDRLVDLLAPAWTCDTRRARTDWGFDPKIDLQSGIKETMAWYREQGWL